MRDPAHMTLGMQPGRDGRVLSIELLGHGVGRRKLGLYWHECRDGDDGAREIYDRHYSRYIYADGRKPKLFVGPGEKMVLITEAGDAVWCWRKFKDASGQQGVNNAIFRNEGTTLSSLLIMDAEQLAWERWPGERLYTYVKPTGIRSTNPGACYKKAGWRVCGITKWKKLVILEKCPNVRDQRPGENAPNCQGALSGWGTMKSGTRRVKPSAAKNKKCMANQNTTTNPKAPAELSSSELLGRVSELEKECGEMVDVLVFQGQHVAAAQMYDAVSGLHKTKSCWNDGIKWDRPNEKSSDLRP